MGNLNEINELLNNIFASDGQFAVTGVLIGDVTILLVIAALLAVVLCLFGLKLIRVWNALAGLLVGGGIGAAVGVGIGLELNGILIAAGVGAVAVAVLAAVFKKFGAFLVCLFGITGTLAGILSYIVDIENPVFVLIIVAVALLMAILAMFWFEPIIIIVTSFYGGTMLANAVAALIGIDNMFITLGIGVATAILGIVVQFMMKSKEIVKKQTKHAETVKGEISKESEVEMARMVLDDEDEE